jgi:hypothetical protein
VVPVWKRSFQRWLTTLDLTADLIVAGHTNDTRATARLLEQIAARLLLEEVVTSQEAMVGEALATHRSRRCLASCLHSERLRTGEAATHRWAGWAARR